MKKIFFRADASREIGYGHFIRSLALADIFKEEYECVFFTQNPSAYQVCEMEKVCQYVSLPSDDSKFDIFFDYLDGSEIVVLDNYFNTSEYEKKIKDKGCKVVTFGSNTRHYYADVIINFTNLSPSDFSAETYTRYCLGLDWVILRSPFYKLRNQSRSNIIICLGGTDQMGYLELFSHAISQIYPSEKIELIATDSIGYDRIHALQSNYSLSLNLNAEQMAQAFSRAKIAIVSASSVAIEALSQGAAVITGYYVDNQINIYNALCSANYVYGVGNFSQPNMISKVIDFINDVERMSKCKIFSVARTIENYKLLFDSLC